VAADVIMPALGMAQDTGLVLRWLRSEGDQVSAGETLVEVETDKATVELESPIDGTLASVQAAEGDHVPVGQVIAVVLAEGEQAASPTPARSEPEAAPAPAPAPAPVAEVPAPVAAVGIARRTRLASPKARRIASDLAIAIDQIEGSGPSGAVVAADVERLRPSPRPADVPAPPARSGVWRIMAEHTTRSWQEIPHFFLHRQLDASALERWRAVAAEAPGAGRVSHTDLLVRIAAEALRRHPNVNANWSDGEAFLEPRINVGIAVATEQALVVPVLHDAGEMPLADITARRQELVAAAREGRLRPADIEGGTFTISNLGMYGVDSFEAIVNGPQAAILAVGRIADRVVAVHGAAVVRPTVQITVSFDHRMVDGARGAEFLRSLSQLIEEPIGLLR
jgi:pyruvate dehydrogenase E2 component (dihydrolipoamide acetyltransferase)